MPLAEIKKETLIYIKFENGNRECTTAKYRESARMLFQIVEFDTEQQIECTLHNR